MDFFSQYKTKEEVKAVYRRLAKAFHPDKGGEAELMMDLQRQFDSWQPKNQFSDHFNFTFNTARRADHVPFDHPLHKEISQLQIDNARLNVEINNLHVNIARERDTANLYKRESYQDRADLLERDREIIRLLKALEEAKKAPLPRLWEYIRQRFVTWYYYEK